MTANGKGTIMAGGSAARFLRADIAGLKSGFERWTKEES